eukprot:327932-Chlamydomonas_euryale.AAC.1
MLTAGRLASACCATLMLCPPGSAELNATARLDDVPAGPDAPRAPPPPPRESRSSSSSSSSLSIASLLS